MPKQYEAVRDRFAAKGMDYDEAQMHAAKIYNAKHPMRPMSGSHDGKMHRRAAMLEQMKGK